MDQASHVHTTHGSLPTTMDSPFHPDIFDSFISCLGLGWGSCLPGLTVWAWWVGRCVSPASALLSLPTSHLPWAVENEATVADIAHQN